MLHLKNIFSQFARMLLEIPDGSAVSHIKPDLPLYLLYGSFDYFVTYQ